jgi:hypothetical protein
LSHDYISHGGVAAEAMMCALVTLEAHSLETAKSVSGFRFVPCPAIGALNASQLS